MHNVDQFNPYQIKTIKKNVTHSAKRTGNLKISTNKITNGYHILFTKISSYDTHTQNCTKLSRIYRLTHHSMTQRYKKVLKWTSDFATQTKTNIQSILPRNYHGSKTANTSRNHEKKKKCEREWWDRKKLKPRRSTDAPCHLNKKKKKKRFLILMWIRLISKVNAIRWHRMQRETFTYKLSSLI